MTANESGKARRRAAPKVQTGCLTCKSRRVKCDETKPECERCKWGGRKCGGYRSIFRNETLDIFVNNQSMTSTSSESETILTPASSSRAASPCPVLDPEPDLLPIERRALHHFLNRSALEFSDSLSGFWRVYVPVLGATSDAVRHALIATSTLHEQMLSGIHPSADSVFALSHYQKAISAANARLREDNATYSTVIEEMLTACALFACIEVMLDAYLRAWNHLQGGLQMLSQLAATDTTSFSPNSQFSDLFELFTLYESQALNYVWSLPSTPFLSEISRHLGSMNWGELVSLDMDRGSYLDATRKAGTGLRHIVRDAQHFMRAHAKGWKYEVNIPSEVVEGQGNHIRLFGKWHGQVYSKLLQIPEEQLREDIRAALAQLTMHYHSTYICLITCLSSNETTVFDSCLPSFQAIISAAEVMLSCTAITNRKFTMESPMIEHVYYTGMKCRDHALRTRAIDLLRRCAKEGVWDGQAVAAVAETAMEIEEAWTRDFVELGLHPYSFSGMDLNICEGGEYEAGYIPEECRIHGLSFDWDQKNRTLRIFDVECSRVIGGHWIKESRIVKY